ncbi:MAG: serine hydrolase domain-containing protein [Thermonemataceae bacterium]
MKQKIFTSIFLLIGTFIYGQEIIEISVEDEQLIDSVGNLYLDANQIPGMGIGVLKNGKVLYSKGLGFKDKNTKEPVTNKTVFHLASISKPFVSTAILQLVEQGKIELDDLVTEHLPYFRMADDRYKSITIEHLLLHTAGIPDVGPSENYEWDKPQDDDEALERYVKSLATWKLEFKPGRKKPSYTNTGYEILGDIISKASGISFEQFMQENIFTPNEMIASSFLLSDIPNKTLSSPHIKNSDGEIEVSAIYPYNREHAPSSCLHSNIEDMLKFAIMNLNKGQYNDKQIYSENTYNLLMTPQVKENKIFQYGLGWNIADFRNTKRIEFTGGDIGFDTVIIMVPSKSFAIVVLSNRHFVTPAFQVINTAFDIASKYN